MFLCIFLFIQSSLAESDPIRTVVIKPSIKHAPPKQIPVISHASKSQHSGHSSIRTNQKCHVDEVELYAEVCKLLLESMTQNIKVCTPTIEQECEDVKVRTHLIKPMEECVDIVRTVCTEVTLQVLKFILNLSM